MKPRAIIFSVLLIACCPSFADQNERFVEFSELPAKTRTYDLSTVQMMQPGRFTILSTSMDDTDVMRFELKALETLLTYCKGPDGNYPPPTSLFTLGPPDLPIKSIEVKSSQTKDGTRQFKSASWSYPYKRLAIEDPGKFVQEEIKYFCKDGYRTDEYELYANQKMSIANGRQNKELFDCKRGIRGDFVKLPEGPNFWPPDPAKVRTEMVKPHSYADTWYRGVCRRVMREEPYSPE